jgi:DNA-binding response OmpR family regulator
MKKGRILVVEQDPDVSKMLQIYFDAMGYEVLTTQALATAALHLCRTKSPFVVLLDIQLPDVDDFLESLQGHLLTKFIKIICLVPEGYQKEASWENLVIDFVAKPFDIENLGQYIEATVSDLLHQNLTHPITNLPAGKVIEQQLKAVKENQGIYTIILCSLNVITRSLTVRGINVLFADIVREIVEEYGTGNDLVLW